MPWIKYHFTTLGYPNDDAQNSNIHRSLHTQSSNPVVCAISWCVSAIETDFHYENIALTIERRLYNTALCRSALLAAFA